MSSPVQRMLSAFVLAGVAGLSPVHAQVPQQPLRSGVGWAMVMPEAFLGVGAFHVFGASGWGVYADGKRTYGSRKNDDSYFSGETVASVEAQFPLERREEVDTSDEWIFVTAGLVRTLSPTLAIVLGGGVARQSVIQEYLDRTEARITSSGFYFVENEAASGWKGNGAVHAIIRVGPNMALSTGLETAAQSISLGAYWLPR